MSKQVAMVAGTRSQRKPRKEPVSKGNPFGATPDLCV